MVGLAGVETGFGAKEDDAADGIGRESDGTSATFHLNGSN
jgi:hypothetical protein